MSALILIAGQSNAEGLAQPFAAELGRYVDVPTDVLELAAGGHGLMAAGQDVPAPFYWLNPNPPAPLAQLATVLPGKDLRAVWWIQGETEALFGTTTEAYSGGLQKIHAGLASLAGKTARSVAFVVSPIAAWDEKYKHTRAVLAAQYGCVQFPNMGVGPEFYDLPNDGIHLTPEGRARFGIRGAQFFAGLALWTKQEAA